MPTARRSSGRRRVALWSSLAVAAGAAAVAHHLLARRSEARHPPRGAFVTVGGVRLHFLEKGSGPAVVLLHGNGVSAEDFRASGLLAALAETHRVIAFDRPGYGYSERPRRHVWTAQAQARLLLRAMAVLGVERPLVVGHSWGSLVAANIALEAPQEISGLVLMSGYYRPTIRPDVPFLAGPAVPVVGDLMRFTVSPVAARLLTPAVLKQLFSPAPVSERFKSDYPIRLSWRPSQLRASAAESMLMGWAAAKLKRRLPRLATPTLILAGRGDKLISFSHQSEWLAGVLADNQFVALEGVGHMLHYTAPDEVAAAIERFSETRQVALDAADPQLAVVPAAT
jgi:pimeloyl-ACP methyl ester carboxylesterase